MKKLLSAILVVALFACLAGIGSAEEAPISVAFAQKTMDGAFFAALGTAMEEACAAEGWSFALYDAGGDAEKQTQNIETAIAANVDLLFVNAVDPYSCGIAVQEAVDAGIYVISIDSFLDESVNVITTVGSSNILNGIASGEYCATCFDDDETISAVILSGEKGNVGGQDRRTGLFAGIIEVRAGVDVEKAKEMATQFNQELTDNGKAFCEEAKLEVLGQGWGNWEENAGMNAMEDLLVANPNINALFGENDSMLLGAMKAIENAALTDQIQIFAAADGQKEALALIQQGSSYKCSGLNSPLLIAETSVQIAHDILTGSTTPEDYEIATYTEAVSITPDNVDQYYDPDSLF